MHRAGHLLLDAVQGVQRHAAVEAAGGRPCQIHSGLHPQRSPALRTIGCMVDPLYCIQSNQDVPQNWG